MGQLRLVLQYDQSFRPSPGTSRGTLEDFFENYIRGQVPFGDYFQHVLAGYELTNEPNIRFISFEELKTDLKAGVLRIARFLGEKCYNRCLDEDMKVLDSIVKQTD